MRTYVFALAVPALLLAACKVGSGDSKVDCPAVAGVATTSKVPADLLDLSHWVLTLPVDSSGAHSGIAATVSSSQLTSGYESEWFETTAGDGVTFFAPIEGATTAHTIYPRSELREVLNPSDNSVNWSTNSISELAAFVTVHQVPSANGKVTVGEIVGYNGSDPDINVLAKLVFEFNPEHCTGMLYTTTLSSPTASGSTANHQVLTRSLRLGEPFPYSIRVDNHQMTFTTGMSSATEAIGTDWDGVGLYFRAGASIFATGSDLSDGARVSFYQLDITHL